MSTFLFFVFFSAVVFCFGFFWLITTHSRATSKESEQDIWLFSWGLVHEGKYLYWEEPEAGRRSYHVRTDTRCHSGKICKEMKENVVVVSSGEGRQCVSGGPAQS